MINDTAISDKTSLVACLANTLIEDITTHELARRNSSWDSHSGLDIPESKASIKREIVMLRSELLKLSKLFDD